MMKMPSKFKPYAPISLVLATLTLSGCAQVDSAKPGTSFTDVVAQFGKPTTECKNSDGTLHAVWTQQPLAETAMGTTVGKDRKIGKVEQLLTDANFERLAKGTWTQQDVLCAFGPPADENEIGIAEKRSFVWSYRYMQSNVWYAMMYVYFDLNSKIVTHFNPGPDPLHTLHR